MEGEVRGIEAKEGQRRKEKEGEREGGKGQKIEDFCKFGINLLTKMKIHFKYTGYKL
jgi:hypothetical protein